MGVNNICFVVNWIYEKELENIVGLYTDHIFTFLKAKKMANQKENNLNQLVM